MAATYHHARRLYIGTTAERAAVVLDVDGIGTDYWDTDVGVLYIWDGIAWVAGFAALPHDILSVTHGDTTPAAAVRGDLMTGQGVVPLWARLAHPGAADRVLQSTALEMGWSAGSLVLGGFTLTVPATGTAVIGGGAGVAGRITYWTDANTLAGDAGLVYNAVTNTITISGAINPVAAAGQSLGDATHRWKLYSAYVDLGNGGWVGILGNELLTVNAAGNFTFSGVTSVVVPDGCWVGADAACSWVYDSTGGILSTLDRVGIGTTTVPHGGVGAAIFAIEGPNASAAGPHVQITTDSDDYPLWQFLSYSHDNMALCFDAYYTAAGWKSSDAGSNFSVYKSTDKLRWRWDAGVAQGGAVTWNTAMSIDLTTGNVGIAMDPTAAGVLCINLPTEWMEIIDAGSAGATEQDWIEVEIGGVQGYLRVFAAK